MEALDPSSKSRSLEGVRSIGVWHGREFDEMITVLGSTVVLLA